jgi:hypothetical protein
VKKLIFILPILFLVNASAEVLNTKIHDIIAPEANEKDYLILSETGDVFEIPLDKKELIDLAYEALENRLPINIDLVDLSINKILGKRERVAKLELLNLEVDNLYQTESGFVPTPLDNYRLTVLADVAEADKVFKTMNTKTRRFSQCYNRAHVWTYELSRLRVDGQMYNTGKIWLFFTRRYIREYKYKWWFHVAPYTKVSTQSEDMILDREFLREPVGEVKWKNIFMKNKANCPAVEYYSDYNNHQESQHCYIMKSSMYYWQPFNIENLEKNGPEKKSWVQSELDQAYRNAMR